MTFHKKVENFVCEKCSHENIGNGFTNHCEKCLWSKHVDVDPGDREAPCAGMMEPIETETKNGELRIKHKCLKCGFERWVVVLPHDNFDAVLAITKKQVDLSY